VGTVVGSGFPPHAARMTPSKRRVPRSTKLFFIDICDILLSTDIEQRAWIFLSGGTSLRLLKSLRVLISSLY
jgi:hypothetical protein